MAGPGILGQHDPAVEQLLKMRCRLICRDFPELDIGFPVRDPGCRTEDNRNFKFSEKSKA